MFSSLLRLPTLGHTDCAVARYHVRFVVVFALIDLEVIRSPESPLAGAVRDNVGVPGVQRPAPRQRAERAEGERGGAVVRMAGRRGQLGEEYAVLHDMMRQPPVGGRRGIWSGLMT